MKSLSEILEEVKTEMCNDYCKYIAQDPPEGKDENWLVNDDESPCGMCPLNRL